MLSTVNRQCKIAKSLDRSSPDLFGGLPIVLLMGDFYQFSPVRGPALWQNPRQGNDEHANGRLIWHRFTNIIILDQQMRQAEDPIFHDMLTRARNATLTEDDLALLNSKTITSLLAPELEGATTVVKMNTLRHHINRIQMEHFARSRSQKIYIFPALHRRTKSTGHTNLRLRADDLLQQPDQGTKTPFPGLFLYTPEMPTVILTNVCTALGQVNGGRGIAVGIVVDPTAEFFEMDDLYILCTKPPACVLFKPHRSRRSEFDDLEASVMPVFPLEKSITLKGYSVRRRQGSTLPTAILDLKDDPASKARDPHKKYCSIYVQLSRLQSLDGLHLLQKIEMRDLQFSPDHRLLAEMERLQGLQRETIAAWDAMA
ncbi:hypothetical protein BKA61DRAFT_621230 [Leptodontidium sp. MPI-SDFR-AT-0119]|nr:hypothetical protein BKA61DRAFT_621230 [Leptodontidium sp. MPI-SDFR-AT-0119]